MPDDDNARHMASLPKMFDGLVKGARDVDAAALAAMVSDAKARAPRDSGELVNGITGHMEGDVAVFSASAIAKDGKHEDYAFFVEHGHGSGVADSDFFAGDGAAALGRRRGGAAVAAHPFFYSATSQPLSERDQALGALTDKMIASAAKE